MKQTDLKNELEFLQGILGHLTLVEWLLRGVFFRDDRSVVGQGEKRVRHTAQHVGEGEVWQSQEPKCLSDKEGAVVEV